MLGEKLASQAAPKGKLDEKLEPVLTFLANLDKLWESGTVTLRQTVIKLAFAGKIPYCRNEGARASKIALLFKALGAFEAMPGVSGGAKGSRTPDLLNAIQALSQLSYGPPAVRGT